MQIVQILLPTFSWLHESTVTSRALIQVFLLSFIYYWISLQPFWSSTECLPFRPHQYTRMLWVQAMRLFSRIEKPKPSARTARWVSRLQSIWSSTSTKGTLLRPKSQASTLVRFSRRKTESGNKCSTSKALSLYDQSIFVSFAKGNLKSRTIWITMLATYRPTTGPNLLA